MTHVSPFTQQDNAILDQIFESRRSVRSFEPDIPPKEDIMRIIRAGLLAPYAAQAVSSQDFGRFFVLPQGSHQLARVAMIAKREVKRMAKQLRGELAVDPSLENEAAGFLKRLEQLAEVGIRGIGTALYYIIAERSGIPPAQLGQGGSIETTYCTHSRLISDLPTPKSTLIMSPWTGQKSVWRRNAA